MFQYKNHRFHFGGVSFRIPDGYFFDSGRKDEDDIFFRLHAPNFLFSVDIRIEKDTDGVMDELQRLLDELDPAIIYPPEPLLMNGLHGCHTAYRNRRSECYEAWFELDSENALTIVITTRGYILSVDTATVLTEIDPRAEDK